MGEKIAGWVEQFATGRARRVFWLVIVALLIWGCLAFPFIDANYFFHGRLETRIDNLTKMTSLSGKPIEESPELMLEYNDILQDMESTRRETDYNIAIKGTPESDMKVKFWSGAFIGIVFTLYTIFTFKPKNNVSYGRNLKDCLLYCFVGIVLSIIFGLGSVCIPTLGWVWVNSVLTPLGIIGFLMIFVVDSK